MNGRMILGLVATAWVSVAATSPTRAAVVLDQAYYETGILAYATLSHPDLGFERVQTLTVGVTGMLHHVDILLSPNSTGPSLVRVLATSGGLPSGTVLGSSSVVSVLGDGWTSIDLSGLGLFVTVGDVIALEPVGLGTWEGRLVTGFGFDSYPAGTSAYRNPDVGIPNWTLDSPPFDLFFRSYVDAGVTRAEHPTWGSIKRGYR